MLTPTGSVTERPAAADPEAIPELSVVVLCYRAQEFIPTFLAAVETAVLQLAITYEVVLVANYVPGSDDRSAAIAAELAKTDPRVRLVARPKEGMMGWDMRTGLEACRGRVLALIDGDGQIDPEDVVKVYRELVAQQADLCQTCRVRRDDGWQRVLISRVYNAVFRLLFPGTGLRDINAKPKVMTRRAYASLQLTSTDWFTDAEIIIQARRQGLRLVEIPAVFGQNRVKPSFINAAAVAEFIKNLIVYWCRDRRQGSRRHGR
jgi:glycosyltransferase involved in cell wall biosynthesis